MPITPPKRPLGSIDVKATSVRLDDAMMRAVQREAELLGTNPSEFVRSAIIYRLGMLAAGRAIGAGATPGQLADHDELMNALGELEARRRA
jgi:predicted transcriptional regulator